MSKVKILEVNKNLTNYTQEVLERVISTQNESQDQLQKAKKLETDLIARIREREERKAAICTFSERQGSLNGRKNRI